MAEEISVQVDLEIGDNLAEVLRALIAKIDNDVDIVDHAMIVVEIKNLIVESIHEVMLNRSVVKKEE